MAADRPATPAGQPPELPFLDRLARCVYLVRCQNAARRVTSASEADDLSPLALPPRALLPVERWRLLAAGAFLLLVAAVVAGLWYLSQPRPVAILEGHTAPVRGLAFSPDCSLLASGSDDGTLRVWDLSSGHTRLTVRHNAPVRCVAFCPGADFVATNAGGFVTFLDPATGEEVGSFAPGGGCFAFSPDGKTLVPDAPSKSVLLYDVASRQVRQRLLGPDLMVCSVALSPAGKTLAAGSFDCRVRVWDLQTARCLTTFVTMTPNWALAFSPDGQLLAAEGGIPSRLMLWDTQSGQERRRLGDLGGALVSVQFSPDGRLLASTSGASNLGWWVMLWDVATCRRLVTLPAGDSSPAVFSRDGRWLATVDNDNAIRIWKVGDLADTDW